MCGICGELRFDRQTPDRDALDRMMACLAKRGPDDAGNHFSGPVALGHRRLSIIDLSNRSHQPMVDDATQLSIVFNGSIYNYPDLREQLRGLGHSFKSHGDTEVILKAYAEWGDGCVARLNGMFAFAIWDERAQMLFMARDRMGIKPLYYTVDPQRIRFASTPQALLAAGGVDTRIDSIALHHQFTLHAVVPAPRTLLRGVRKIQPAHSLSIDADGNQRERQYWNLIARRPATPRSEDEWIDRVHSTLRTAVKRRLDIADVPVGVLLSGGLDSSLLVGLLAEAGATGLKTLPSASTISPRKKAANLNSPIRWWRSSAPIITGFLFPIVN